MEYSHENTAASQGRATKCVNVRHEHYIYFRLFLLYRYRQAWQTLEE